MKQNWRSPQWSNFVFLYRNTHDACISMSITTQTQNASLEKSICLKKRKKYFARFGQLKLVVHLFLRSALVKYSGLTKTLAGSFFFFYLAKMCMSGRDRRPRRPWQGQGTWLRLLGLVWLVKFSKDRWGWFGLVLFKNTFFQQTALLNYLAFRSIINLLYKRCCSL